MLAEAFDQDRLLPDILLLDFLMAGCSGLGILRVMRRFGAAPPTIIMTAFPEPPVEVFARKMGALSVIRKPLAVDDVIRAVAEAAALVERRRDGLAR